MRKVDLSILWNDVSDFLHLIPSSTVPKEKASRFKLVKIKHKHMFVMIVVMVYYEEKGKVKFAKNGGVFISLLIYMKIRSQKYCEIRRWEDNFLWEILAIAEKSLYKI